MHGPCNAPRAVGTKANELAGRHAQRIRRRSSTETSIVELRERDGSSLGVDQAPRPSVDLDKFSKFRLHARNNRAAPFVELVVRPCIRPPLRANEGEEGRYD